ncbi:MAG TPA: type II secretion system protein [Candidatus Woesebacteria bacterium]|nr:type II secretion system protein [Candidatus Woesebacteria bacterium]
MLIKHQSKGIFGFSLIELLVVISIIGVLTAVLTANFMGMRERARDAQKIQDLNSMKSALRIYYNDHQSYPATQADFVKDVGTSNYMPNLMGIGFSYNYLVTSGGDGFVLTAPLESGAGTDDTDSQTKCGLGASDKIFAVCAN